ncbi:MAG: hypothetical protein EZS28_013158 [Streblomastix strix]|uniref:Defective in cullin neddylation protein n=1 Tax=Streblomastix strix TaxID=222440 RepID=A0A5J4W9H9_9EUKA|nr:MAG: hypothetical protein EZS28_013158 [Streblomastix strix]
MFYHFRTADASEDMILEDGFIQFLEDIDVNPESDIMAFVIVWQFKCTRKYKFEKIEFIEGCRKLGVDDAQSFKRKLGDLRNQLRDEKKEKKVQEINSDTWDQLLDFGKMTVGQYCWMTIINGQKNLSEMCPPLYDPVTGKPTKLVSDDAPQFHKRLFTSICLLAVPALALLF